MNITIRQMRIFIEVATRGSMLHAASALHLSPPAVSLQLKELESQLGLVLFNRNNRQVSLSNVGNQFLVYAKRLIADLGETENAMARLKRLDHGSVTIGLVGTAAQFMPRLLARFREDYPGVEVKMRVMHNHKESAALLESVEVDLMVSVRPTKGLGPRANVKTFALNPLVFAAPFTYSLPANASRSAKMLNQQTLLVREHGTRVRAVLDAFCNKHRCTPRAIMEIPSTETIKHSVIAGIGIGFLPLLTIGLELRNGLLQVLDIAGTPAMDVWNVTHLRSRVLSPSAETFRNFIIEHGAKDLRSENRKLLALAFKRKIPELEK